MKAWKHKTTGELHDIQTIPRPLPAGYDPAEWKLTDVTEADISALAKIHTYVHTPRGLAGLLTEPLTLFSQKLERIL